MRADVPECGEKSALVMPERMVVDNFELLAGALLHEGLPQDEFLFLQILVRSKDGIPCSGNNRKRLVNMYCIRSADDLFRYRDEIIALCRATGARAYLNPTRRSVKVVAREALLLAAAYTANENWSAWRTLYASACGKSFVATDKKFVVDLDDMTPDDDTFKAVETFIFEARGQGGPRGDKVVVRVPTRSGWHLVTKPFDMAKFAETFPGIVVQKNNPTLLYYEGVKTI